MDTAALQLRIETTGMDAAQKGLENLEGVAGVVESAVRKAAAAFALFKAGTMIGDMTQLAARYETLGVVMRVVGNNAGYTAVQMETFAQALQKQGISMIESRNTLAMMASAHIDLANAAKLGRIAQDAAVIGGINSSEAFQRMTYGIQSGQVEILRTIGINVNFEQSYKALAKQLGKTAQELTEQEKTQARVNAVMEKGKDIAGAYEESLGTVGKAAASMKRIWDDLQVILGQVFQEGFTVVINGMTEAMKTATEWAKKNGTALNELGKAIGDTMKAGTEFSKLLRDIGGGSEGATGTVGFLSDIFRGLSLIIAGTTDTLRAFWGELNGYLGAMIQKVGRLADLLTSLAGFSGEGGITRFGKSWEEYGNRITAGLSDGTAVGRTLDGMLSSHGTGTNVDEAKEAQRIAAAKEREAQARREAAAARAAEIAAQQVQVKTYAQLEGPDFMVMGLYPNQRSEGPQIQQWDQAAYDYQKAIKTLDRDLAIFAKNNRTNWDLISEVIQDSSRMASDSLVAWMDNLDGVGRSWKTLGDTVKAVLRDMIIQMQRAIVQQQLMDPLLKAFVGWAPSLFGGGTKSPTTGGTAGGGLNFGDAGASFSKPMLAPTIQVNVSSEGQVSAETAGNGAADLWGAIEPALNSWAIKQSRQGGLLARA